jgi:hypothetical protein
VSRPAQAEAAKAERPASASTKQATTTGEGQAELPNLPQANSSPSKQAEPSDTTQADNSNVGMAERTDTTSPQTSNVHEAKPPSTELAEAPSTERAESSSLKHPADPALVSGTESNADSGKVREQVMAAANMAKRLTDATGAAAEPGATEHDGSRSSEDPDGDLTAATSSNTADARIAVLVSRREITSMSDLAGKDVAIDNSRSESENSVRTALVAAGAPAVELSVGNASAIDRLVGGDVPAAVVALVSPDAADAFPDIAGFKVYRIPLSPPSMKSGTDKP